jgi:hypothetical protein
MNDHGRNHRTLEKAAQSYAYPKSEKLRSNSKESLCVEEMRGEGGEGGEESKRFKSAVLGWEKIERCNRRMKTGTKEQEWDSGAGREEEGESSKATW